MTKPPSNPSESIRKSQRASSKSKAKHARTAQKKFAPVLKFKTAEEWTQKIDELVSVINKPRPEMHPQSAENNSSIRSIVPIGEFCEKITRSLLYCQVVFTEGKLSNDHFKPILSYLLSDRAVSSFGNFCYYWVQNSQLANGLGETTASKRYRILTRALGSFCDRLLQADCLGTLSNKPSEPSFMKTHGNVMIKRALEFFKLGLHDSSQRFGPVQPRIDKFINLKLKELGEACAPIVGPARLKGLLRPDPLYPYNRRWASKEELSSKMSRGRGNPLAPHLPTRVSFQL